jgi:hypothetical protein
MNDMQIIANQSNQMLNFRAEINNFVLILKIFTHLTNASITTTILPTANDNLKEKSDDIKKITFKKSVNEKGVKLFRWSRERDLRFPIRPPKLKKVNETEKTIEKARIGYASVLQIRQTNLNTTVTPMRKTAKKVNRKRLSNANQVNVSFNLFIYRLLNKFLHFERRQI